MSDLHKPCLYIVMRTDIASLRGAGKACAQAAHAANQFQTSIEQNHPPLSATLTKRAYDVWNGHGHGFGTTIILDYNKMTVGERQRESPRRPLEDQVAIWKEQGYFTDTVTDGSFPVMDGKARFYVPTITCAYLFTPDRKGGVPIALSNLHLME